MNNANETHEPPMTVKELSDYLRLDRMTIYKMLKLGELPASRIAHQWRFFRVDIDAWIRSKRVGYGVEEDGETEPVGSASGRT